MPPPTPRRAGRFETVVVTAERRSENLMTAPVTASVIAGDDLLKRNVFDVKGLQFIAPNVTVNDLGQGIDFDIRGIGKGEHNTQTPPGVVHLPRRRVDLPGLSDVGALLRHQERPKCIAARRALSWARNATGGAVFVSTNDPVIGGDYNGYVMAQFGNYSDGQLQGAVNIPLTDDLAIRIAAFGEARGSFYSIIDRDPADRLPAFQI